VTRLALVRHGQTDWNLHRRIQGVSDIPLNQTGRDQARTTGRALAAHARAGHVWREIVASPLSRALETAHIIAEEVGLADPAAVTGLEERRYGEAEGLTGEQILARFPDGTAVPGQETRAEVVHRALAALRGIGDAVGRRTNEGASDGSSVIVVSHGGVISSLVRHITAGALPAPGEVIANGSVHEFELVDGELILGRFNLGPDDYDLFTAAVS
jgi:Fructose-2,6-bisphosphatase